MSDFHTKKPTRKRLADAVLIQFSDFSAIRNPIVTLKCAGKHNHQESNTTRNKKSQDPKENPKYRRNGRNNWNPEKCAYIMKGYITTLASVKNIPNQNSSKRKKHQYTQRHKAPMEDMSQLPKRYSRYYFLSNLNSASINWSISPLKTFSACEVSASVR